MREADEPVDKALFSKAVRATRGGFGSYAILVQAPPKIPKSCVSGFRGPHNLTD